MLNAPRILMRHAALQARGMRMAAMGQLPLAYFDAVSLSDEEAQKAQFEYNLAQTIAEAKRQRTF